MEKYLLNINLNSDSVNRARYVFIGGLHRSGTSLTSRLIGSLKGVSSIVNSPAPENEGVYLQGAIPHDALAGKPMEFATDPEQHLTEHSSFNSLETRLRLEHDWTPWYAADAKWRVEKSPVNLTRMRLLQQLFPTSQFVVVLRHPEIVAAAMKKWSEKPASTMIDHWLDAHDILMNDIKRLHNVLVLRYEDIVANPRRCIKTLAAFLDIQSDTTEDFEIIRNGNVEYQDAIPLAIGQIDRAKNWGYDIHGSVVHWPTIVQHQLRSIRETTQANAAA